jgi:threonine aldolase
MVKKQKVNKTQAVRDYMKDHPKAMSGEIAAALNKKGIKITPSYVANVKTIINKARTAKKAAKQQAAVEVAAPAVVEKPTKAGDTITLDQVKKVAQTIKAIGGFQRVTEVLEVIRELGGVRKFKDLAEAMSATETDVIPF